MQGRESLNAINQTRGGEGDMALRDIQAALVAEDLDGLNHIFEVIERFSHSHEHDIAEVPAEFFSGMKPDRRSLPR